MITRTRWRGRLDRAAHRRHLIRGEHDPAAERRDLADHIGFDRELDRAHASFELGADVEVAQRGGIPRTPRGRPQRFDHGDQLADRRARVTRAALGLEVDAVEAAKAAGEQLEQLAIERVE